MGNIIIKPARDRDEYVYWSTNVEAPIAYGDREGMAEILAEDFSGRAPANLPEVRLLRTDERGSSALDIPIGYWGDDEFVYEQRGLLRRADLFRAAVLLAEGRESEVWDLLSPFEEGMEVRRD